MLAKVNAGSAMLFVIFAAIVEKEAEAITATFQMLQMRAAGEIGRLKIIRAESLGTTTRA